jgi:dolichol-phosphate mannosyltransferase
MFLSIVIAVYNEEENVSELTNRIFSCMVSLKIPFELIYVVDGTDKSIDILRCFSKDHTNLILDYSPKLRGFRNAFVKGFSLINKDATHVLTMDADLNHQPEEISSLLKKMASSNADIVIGSRYVKKGKVDKIECWKRAVSILANFIIKAYWGLSIKDKTSGYRLYKRKVIAAVVPLCKSQNFEFLFEILINSVRKNCIIVEVPIHFKPRKAGESKFQLWKTSKGYLKLMLRYH